MTMRQGFTARAPWRAFVFIELPLVILFIAVLAALLFPIFAKARDKARQTTCATQLRHVGAALQAYVADWDGHLVPGAVPYRQDVPGPVYGSPDWRWADVVAPYLRNPNLLVCPEQDVDGVVNSYGWNYTSFGNSYDDHGTGWSTDARRVRAAEVFVAGDNERKSARGLRNVERLYLGVPAADPEHGLAPSRHRHGGNCLYLDGHVRWRAASWLAQPGHSEFVAQFYPRP